MVYGTGDGSAIQSAYIDRDALGDVPPAVIQVVNPHGEHRGSLFPKPLALGPRWVSCQCFRRRYIRTFRERKIKSNTNCNGGA